MLEARVHHAELLDGDAFTEQELFRNLDELHIINRFLGGYRVSAGGVARALPRAAKRSIADIGCGGGHALAFLQRKFAHGKLDLYGIDIKPLCIDYCKAHYPDIRFICDDYRNLQHHVRPGIVHAALFCHHLTDAQIQALVVQCLSMKAVLVINDLHRHPVAYWSIRLLTRLFSGSRLVKNDAPLSVSRGFTREEWRQILSRAGAREYEISWRWAFRHRVIVYG